MVAGNDYGQKDDLKKNNGNVSAGKTPRGEGMPENGIRPRHLVEKVEFTPVPEDHAEGERYGIDVFNTVKLKVSGELGKTSVKVRDFINLDKGSMLKLDRLADENLTLLVNDAPFAYGEIVVINDRYGVRITAFLDHDPRENV
ncbi:MAG: FliM/FliN family flagellar motor switch protein [Dethiobacteria bacterium]